MQMVALVAYTTCITVCGYRHIRQHPKIATKETPISAYRGLGAARYLQPISFQVMMVFSPLATKTACGWGLEVGT